MTARYMTDPLAEPLGALTAAREHVAAAALTPTAQRRVGLELEYHLVDLAQPERRPDWPAIRALTAGIPPLPAGSSVTVEPGGQIELSTPPAGGVVDAVAALRADEAALRRILSDAGFGAAALGADPARPLRRVNPGARYVAMEQHFDAVGCAPAGRAMMAATAALQVNLDAGPASGWSQRLALVDALVPVLVALSASSPWLAGQSSGWASMREQAWQGIDPGRSGRLPTGEPGEAWAEYALSAPVMLVQDGPLVAPVTQRVPFRSWVVGEAPIERRPTLADLDYHLTTLFPPVRPRGYVEIRCLDAVPGHWWPALATITTVLIDDFLAADVAAEACEPLAASWHSAAYGGLADSAVGAAARRCVAVAAERCPPELAAEVQAFAEAVEAGRGPLEEVRDRVRSDGPLATLAGYARE